MRLPQHMTKASQLLAACFAVYRVLPSSSQRAKVD